MCRVKDPAGLRWQSMSWIWVLGVRYGERTIVVDGESLELQKAVQSNSHYVSSGLAGTAGF